MRANFVYYTRYRSLTLQRASLQQIVLYRVERVEGRSENNALCMYISFAISYVSNWVEIVLLWIMKNVSSSSPLRTLQLIQSGFISQHSVVFLSTHPRTHFRRHPRLSPPTFSSVSSLALPLDLPWNILLDIILPVFDVWDDLPILINYILAILLSLNAPGSPWSCYNSPHSPHSILHNWSLSPMLAPRSLFLLLIYASHIFFFLCVCSRVVLFYLYCLGTVIFDSLLTV